MSKKKCLNEKRLTKQRVQELIDSEGRLHQEFTQVLEEITPIGQLKQDLVYELTNDRYLLVFDPKGGAIGGKGDIYAKDYFVRFISWVKRVKEDYTSNRASSFDHWLYYSKNKESILIKIEELIQELATKLNIDSKVLDLSYGTLDLVSAKAEAYGIEKVQHELYDNLVAYIGEVMRKQINGRWDFDGIPIVRIENNQAAISPVNIVWSQLTELEPMNLRQETVNELKSYSRYSFGKKAKEKTA